MRWPFWGKKRDITHLTIPPADEQRWSVAQGEVGGCPLVVRFNESARKLAGHSGLSIKLGFAVPLNRPNHGASPMRRRTKHSAQLRTWSLSGCWHPRSVCTR